MKKYISEFIGTAILVVLGCGTAMLVGCDPTRGTGYLLTALAFGLAIVANAYSVGNVSGCHINPAVSVGMFFAGKLKLRDLIGYIISQCLGALCGSALLGIIFDLGDIKDMTGAFGSNGFAGVSGNPIAALLVEIVLTFIFLMAIFGVTSSKAEHGSFGGLVIGLTLTVVHILGIGLTGTSVNPARSFGPAVLSMIRYGKTAPLAELWVFIIGPIAGAIAAACVYAIIEAGKKEAKKN